MRLISLFLFFILIGVDAPASANIEQLHALNRVLTTTYTKSPATPISITDGIGHLTGIAEPTGGSTFSKEYVYLGDMPLAVTNGSGGFDYVHTDHLGTPRVITNAAGQVVWQWDNADAYGNNVPNENPSSLGVYHFGIGFAGQYRDRETNTVYNINRNLNTATGRYNESDLIGLAGGINTFGHVEGNPLSYTDPYGLASLYTDMRGGTTTFDSRPEDPDGQPFVISTSTSVSQRAKKGANEGFSTPNVVGVRHKGNSRAFGPDGAVIDVGDARGRHIHGGGSCRAVADAQSDQQGWCATMGCTRGQNSDVLDLADKIMDFKKVHPGVKIPYYRY